MKMVLDHISHDMTKFELQKSVEHNRQVVYMPMLYKNSLAKTTIGFLFIVLTVLLSRTINSYLVRYISFLSRRSGPRSLFG